MISSKTFDVFLALVRQGVGHEGRALSQEVDWTAIKALADTHGLSAVVLDGIAAMRKMNFSPALPSREGIDFDPPPQEMLLEWIGEVMQEYEQRYKLYKQAISEMAAFYNSHGFKMMVLKGFACSLDWPKPEHRPCGDIDIWQFGRQKEADAILTREKGMTIDTNHHHHTVFNWQGFMVENHYDFINVYHHKSHSDLEKIFKELGKNDSNTIIVNGEKVNFPSPQLYALFLLKHLTLHFSTGELTIRQLLDWAFFVEKHGKEVDWDWMDEELERFGLKDIYGIFNAICVEYLGFNPKIFPYVEFKPDLKERVINNIFSPEFRGKMPKGLLRRIFFKYRRWKANEWKHKLCYKESMWSAFWSGVWSHLLKPSSI